MSSDGRLVLLSEQDRTLWDRRLIEEGTSLLATALRRAAPTRYAVEAAIAGNAVPLVVVAVLCSAIAAFFYVRVIVLMYFSEPSGDATTVAVPSALMTVALTIGVAMTALVSTTVSFVIFTIPWKTLAVFVVAATIPAIRAARGNVLPAIAPPSAAVPGSLKYPEAVIVRFPLGMSSTRNSKNEPSRGAYNAMPLAMAEFMQPPAASRQGRASWLPIRRRTLARKYPLKGCARDQNATTNSNVWEVAPAEGLVEGRDAHARNRGCFTPGVNERG